MNFIIQIDQKSHGPLVKKNKDAWEEHMKKLINSFENVNKPTHDKKSFCESTGLSF